jgi:hypothetical protein
MLILGTPTKLDPALAGVLPKMISYIARAAIAATPALPHRHPVSGTLLRRTGIKRSPDRTAHQVTCHLNQRLPQTGVHAHRSRARRMVVQQARPLHGSAYALPDQSAGHGSGRATRRVSHHLDVRDLPRLTAHFEHRPPEVARKLSNPPIIVRHAVLTHIVDVLGQRTKWFGANSGHTHLSELGAKLTRQAVGQPGCVVRRDDHGTRPGPLNHTRYQLSHARNLPHRKHQISAGKIQGKERQGRVYHGREIRRSSPRFHRPGSGSETRNVFQKAFTIVTLIENKQLQSRRTTRFPT